MGFSKLRKGLAPAMAFLLLPLFSLSAIEDGFLPNGDFESVQPSAVSMGHLMEPLEEDDIPSWKLNGTVELVSHNQKQDSVMLLVPHGNYALRLGNEAEVRQKLDVKKGAVYAVSFCAARTCSQFEAINVSVPPATQEVDLQTAYSVRGWDAYAAAFLAGNDEVELGFSNQGMDDDPSCGPLLDSIAIKELTGHDQPKGNFITNGDFEEGPWVFKNASPGILIPTNPDPKLSPLPGWSVVSNRAVRYVDSESFRVPQGKYAIELLSGKEGVISQILNTTPKKEYTLTFTYGLAQDKCKQPIAVTAHIGDRAMTEHYIADANFTFQVANLNFTAEEEKTRVSFSSVYYNVLTDDLTSLCGPVVDDVRVWASSAIKSGFGMLGLGVGFWVFKMTL